MKKAYTLRLVSAFFLFLKVSAKPWQFRHSHEHAQLLDKRANVIVYTTIVKTVYSQATAAPDAIVYIVANGDRRPITQGKSLKPVQTLVTETTLVKTAAPTSLPLIKSDQQLPDIAGDRNDTLIEDSSDLGTARGAGWGFSYAPFKGDGSCKSADEIKKDFEKVGKEYALVRIYGTSCNQVETVLGAAQKRNLQIFAGIFDINQVETEAKLIIAAGKKDWARFDTVSVGNELVNNAPDDQKASVAAKVISAMNQVRSMLKSAGFKGKVVTVDTLMAARAFPSLCSNSDYCAVNCHPFFDGNVKADAAGTFVSEQVATLAKVIPKSQKIVVTETGWPWRGLTNKAAVPSLTNQELALASIKNIFESNKAGVILFTIFNDRWKSNTAATFGAEQFWGMRGIDAPSG